MNNKKTMKTILFALLVLSIAVPTTSMALAAEASPVGKDIIITERVVEVNPDLQRMQSIVDAMDNPELSDNAKIALEQEADELRQKAIIEGQVDPETAAIVKGAQLALRPMFLENSQFGINAMQKVIVGYGVSGDKLVVHIAPEYFDANNIDAIVKDVRNVVGNKVTIEFSEGDRPVPTSCASQTSDCAPVEGGVKIENNFGGPCSVGFQAKDGSTEGFITAGHCITTGSGSTNDVFQPNKYFFLLNKVGDATIDGFYHGTRCDCGFVDADESIEDEIYSNIQASGIGSIVYNDYMTTKGYSSGSFTGQIKFTSYDTVYGGNAVLDMFLVNTPAKDGDSGGPTYESGASTPEIMGFVGATGSVYSYNSKASNVNTILGVSLDFT